MGMISAIRTIVFYFLLASITLLWLPPSLLIGPLLPYRWRYRLIAVAWSRVTLMLARWVLGIRYRISGLENVPERPCVILAKHQSAWETFFLSAHFQRSEEHTSELQSRPHLVCRLLLEKKKKKKHKLQIY